MVLSGELIKWNVGRWKIGKNENGWNGPGRWINQIDSRNENESGKNWNNENGCNGAVEVNKWDTSEGLSPWPELVNWQWTF